MLYQRPGSPYWWYKFEVNRKMYRGSTKETNKKRALTVEMEIRKEIEESVANNLTLGRTKEVALGDLAKLWYEVEGSKLKDAKNNESRIRKLLGKLEVDGEPIPGLNPSTKVHLLQQSEIQHLYDTRISMGNAVATANREVSLIQALLTFARQRGFMVPDWREELKTIKRKEPKGKQRFLSPDEERILLEELDPKGDPRKVDQYDLTVLLLDTGSRYGEAVRLQWTDVDFDQCAVTIYRSKTENGDTMLMSERVFEILKRRWNSRDPRNLFVFPGRTPGTHRSYAVKGIRAAMTRAGINDDLKSTRYGKATVHSMRDTFASKLVKGGASLYHVQKLLGHSTPQMSQKYAKLQVSEASKVAVAILNKTA